MLVTNLALRSRTTVLILCAIIFIAGLEAYVSLPRESAPDIEFPFILVTTVYEGASPSDIESLITYPIERKLKNLSDVKEMTSTSSEGFSVVFLEFEPSIDIDTALQKVRDKVDEAKPDLPDDLFDDPAVREISSNEEWPVLLVNISGDIGQARLKDIAEDMEEDVENIQGVLDAEILGGREREIRVEFDPDRVAAYGLTMAEIIQTVSQNNVNTPGGSIDIGEAKYSFKTPTEFVAPDEIFRLVVAMRGQRPIYISDIASVRDTFKDRDSFARVDGREAVTVKVTKRSGEHLLRIANDVKQIVANYRDRYPANIHFTITSDGSRDVKMMVSDLENNILTGLILVLAVIFLALGIRNAVLVALAIPLSMLVSFFTLQILGITLNMVVLFSLILALGMLVDNAIVIVENIYRHHVDERRPLLEAAQVGTQEVAWPVIASTATTVAAFAPLIFWPGIMGQFMSYLPKTVIIVLIASLFVALVINPTLASLFIRRPRGQRAEDSETDSNEAGSGEESANQPEEREYGLVIRAYRRLLRFGLAYRALSVLFFFALLYLAIFAYGHSGLGVELFPDTEPNRIMVDIEAPQGTNVYRTNDFARRAEGIIGRYGNVEHVTVNVGAGSGGHDSGAHNARITVDMVIREERKGPAEGVAEGEPDPDGLVYFRDSNRTMAAIRKEVTDALVGAKVTVDKQEEGPPTGPPVNVEVAGDRYELLAEFAKRLRGDIRDVPGIVDLTDDYKTGLPEVEIRVDKERAALLGLSSFLVGQLVKACVNGIKVGDYREGEDEYDITARLAERHRQNLEDITRLRVPAPDGRQVPLTSVASIDMESGLSSIRHIDAKRVVSVSSNVAKGYNSDQVLKRVQFIARNGRSLLRREDLRDPAGFLNALRDGNEPMAAELRARLSEDSLSSLRGWAGGPPSEQLVNHVVADINRAFEAADLEAAARARAANGKGALAGFLSSMKASFEEAPAGEPLVRANRLALEAVWPEFIASVPEPPVLPSGYSYRYTGENEEREESAAFMSRAFVTAVLLIALVLVTQFNSVVKPFIILASVILSFIGVFLGLIVTRQPFGIIMTGMGVISLAGVVVNNAIVLIDYTNLLRERGRSCYDAIIEAGCVRFRPVMLTAITTVLGLVPMAVGISYDFRNLKWQVGSESSQWWGSMATAVIFGLVVATALTLFMIPCLYSMVDSLQRFGQRLTGRARKREAAAPAEMEEEKAIPEAPPPQPAPAK